MPHSNGTVFSGVTMIGAATGKANETAAGGAEAAFESAGGIEGTDFHSHLQLPSLLVTVGTEAVLQHESAFCATTLAMQQALLDGRDGAAQGGAPARIGNAATIRASEQRNLSIKAGTLPTIRSIA